jgi:hypothetical protein
MVALIAFAHVVHMPYHLNWATDSGRTQTEASELRWHSIQERLLSEVRCVKKIGFLLRALDTSAVI